MCVVSAVMDQWRPGFYPPYVPSQPIGPPQPVQLPPPLTPDELRELIESFHKAVKAAETFDKLTGQPDCVDPEKAALMDRVAELERRLDEIEAAP